MATILTTPTKILNLGRGYRSCILISYEWVFKFAKHLARKQLRCFASGESFFSDQETKIFLRLGNFYTERKASRGLMEWIVISTHIKIMRRRVVINSGLELSVNSSWERPRLWDPDYMVNLALNISCCRTTFSHELCHCVCLAISTILPIYFLSWTRKGNVY